MLFPGAFSVSFNLGTTEYDVEFYFQVVGIRLIVFTLIRRGTEYRSISIRQFCTSKNSIRFNFHRHIPVNPYFRSSENCTDLNVDIPVAQIDSCEIEIAFTENNVVLLIRFMLIEFLFTENDVIRSGLKPEKPETSKKYPQSDVDEKHGEQHLDYREVHVEYKSDDESKSDQDKQCSPKNSSTHFHDVFIITVKSSIKDIY